MNEYQQRLIEFAYYRSPDGVEYPLFGGQRVLLSWQNVGMPQWNYLTDRGPFQNGSTVRDYRADERVVTLREYERGSCREDWWCAEGELIDALRPNRSSTVQPGKLLFILPDHAEKETEAYILRGPGGDWDATGSRSPADLRESMQFLCPDPFWNDPDLITVNATLDIDDSCLKFCLPACLGSGIINETFDITYCGTWFGDTMTIEITGPISGPAVTALPANKTIQMLYSVASGEKVTIAITPNVVTLINNFGQRLKGTVANPGDLTEFVLWPRSDLTADGVNQIRVSGSGGVEGVTGFSISYLTRHVALFAPCIDCP